MKCAHCGHSHVDPQTGQMDADRCFAADAEGEPCPCRDFDF